MPHSSLIFKTYNNIIKYQNYKTAIYDVLEKKLLPNKFISFYSIIQKHIIKNKDKILQDLREMKDSELNDAEVYCGMYNMNDKLCYKELYDNMNNIINKIEN